MAKTKTTETEIIAGPATNHPVIFDMAEYGLLMDSIKDMGEKGFSLDALFHENAFKAIAAWLESGDIAAIKGLYAIRHLSVSTAFKVLLQYINDMQVVDPYTDETETASLLVIKDKENTVAKKDKRSRAFRSVKGKLLDDMVSSDSGAVEVLRKWHAIAVKEKGDKKKADPENLAQVDAEVAKRMDTILSYLKSYGGDDPSSAVLERHKAIRSLRDTFKDAAAG